MLRSVVFYMHCLRCKVVFCIGYFCGISYSSWYFGYRYFYGIVHWPRLCENKSTREQLKTWFTFHRKIQSIKAAKYYFTWHDILYSTFYLKFTFQTATITVHIQPFQVPTRMAYQLGFPKPLTRPLLLKQCLPLGSADQGSGPQLNLPRESVLSGARLCSPQWLRNRGQPAGQPAVVKVSFFHIYILARNEYFIHTCH